MVSGLLPRRNGRVTARIAVTRDVLLFLSARARGGITKALEIPVTKRDTAATATNPFDLPGPHWVIPHFLGADTVAQLLGHAAERQAEFQPSRIGALSSDGSVDPDFRISSRLDVSRELERLVIGRVRECAGDLFLHLGIPAFEPSGWEVELVAHGHGAFFKRHIDTSVGAPDMAKNRTRSMRVVSLVYYFHRLPRRFHGGELRLHALTAPGSPGSFVDIAPENDTALAFPSWFPHEVLPVTCESRVFMDSRFAVNCWLYR
jgi:Rps23 Pro-64 3,4-dihydroxylase Tpa1-like proline 4-hydroxylase